MDRTDNVGVAALPKFIGLTGRMASGKDTVAGILSRWGYRRIAFADALKQEVADALVAPVLPADLPDELRGPLSDIRLGWAPRSTPWDKPTLPNMRRILQLWGTEYRREMWPGYWIERLLIKMAEKPDQRWAISDVRFSNEASALQMLMGVVWRIDRPGVRTSDHVSETGIDELEVDAIIDNSGSLEDLKLAVETALRQGREFPFTPPRYDEEFNRAIALMESGEI